MLVDRHLYIVVDGGRANIPLPHDMKITQWEYDFFSMFDSLERQSEFDRYLREAGITVE